MPVSQEARRVYERFKPVEDRETQDRAAWLRTHLLPGEGMGSALRRRAALAAPRKRTRLAATVAAIELERSRVGLMRGRYDDGMHDDEWCDQNPKRAYRIRSVRPSDNAWWFVTAPAILVVDTRTHESLFVPPTIWAADPVDHDLWGAMVFAARDAFEAKNGVK